MIARFLGAQWLAAGFVGLVSLGASALIARALRPELFGAYIIPMAAGAVVGIFMGGGFDVMGAALMTVICANTSSLPIVVGDAGVLIDPRDEGALASAMCGRRVREVVS